MSMHLRPGGQQFGGDDGSANPAVVDALTSFGTGQGSEHAALVALAASRLLVPVIALLTEADEDGAEKSSEMALPTLIGQDGRPAIIAFTSVASLARWRADARPMPAEAGRVWQAAVADNAAVVIDVAGPVPFAVEGARLNALAAGQPPPRPDEDPDVHAVIESVLAALAEVAGPTVEGARLGPPTAPGADLHVQLLIAPGGEQAIQPAAERISAVLAGRFRRGVEFSAGVLKQAQ
jgi:hypothetical protein